MLAKDQSQQQRLWGNKTVNERKNRLASSSAPICESFSPVHAVSNASSQHNSEVLLSGSIDDATVGQLSRGFHQSATTLLSDCSSLNIIQYFNEQGK